MFLFPFWQVILGVYHLLYYICFIAYYSLLNKTWLKKNLTHHRIFLL